MNKVYVGEERARELNLYETYGYAIKALNATVKKEERNDYEITAVFNTYYRKKRYGYLFNHKSIIVG